MTTFKTLKGMLDSGSPWVVAHRGDSRFCPENTMSAFRSAMEKGAEMIECDIHLSRDRIPVVIHDSSLDRTTNGSGTLLREILRSLVNWTAEAGFLINFLEKRCPSLNSCWKKFQEKSCSTWKSNPKRLKAKRKQTEWNPRFVK